MVNSQVTHKVPLQPLVLSIRCDLPGKDSILVTLTTETQRTLTFMEENLSMFLCALCVFVGIFINVSITIFQYTALSSGKSADSFQAGSPEIKFEEERLSHAPLCFNGSNVCFKSAVNLFQ